MKTNIYTYTGGLVATNAWFLETERGCILFDAPGGVAAWLTKAGLKPDLLALTHLHFDHVMGAAEVVEACGCPVVAREDLSPELTLEKYFRGFAGSSFAIKPFPIQKLAREDGAAELAGNEFTQFYVPGHSPDSVCFWHAESGVLIAGDTLFYGGIGRPDFPGGDEALLVRGIREKLLVLPEETRVLPGHGPETTVERERRENPFLR